MKKITLVLVLLFGSTVNAFAQLSIPAQHQINPSFAIHMGIIEDMHDGLNGIYITSPEGELVLAMSYHEIETTVLETAGKFLIAYDDSGQALYINADGEYEMSLTINDSSINLSYLPNHRNRLSLVEDSSYLEQDVMLQDVILKESTDGLYRIVLLTTGELQVQMQSANDRIEYHVTFTGIPALNVKYSVEIRS